MHTGPVWIVHVAALLVAGCAWLVRSRQRIELINLIDPRRVADRAGLARLAGNLLYAIAAMLVASALATQFELASEVVIAASLGMGVLVSTAWLYIGAQDYMKP